MTGPAAEFRVLDCSADSPMYTFPTPQEMRCALAPFAALLTPADRATLEDVLRWDLLSEYDARFFSEYLKTLDLDYTEHFLAVEEGWASDEERHYRFFHEAYDEVSGITPAFLDELGRRKPDFQPIAHLFEDEFSIACLGAYDELATVRAFKKNLPNYDKLGPGFGKLLRRIIADEARHYHRFLEVLRKEHAHRSADAPAVVARIRATEGTAYANTFVLDHDDPIFTDDIYDEAEAILLKHICRVATVA